MEEGKPLDKATATKEIRERLANDKAKLLAQNAAMDALEKKNFDSKKDTGLIPRTAQGIPKIGQVPKDGLAIFSLTKENPVYQKPIEIEGKYYVFFFK